MRNTVVDSSSPILVVEDISKAYSGTPVLSDLTFSAMPGDLTVVYGPPAAGKSVLVRVLTGLEQPDSGRIILRGQDVTHEAPAERNIGYVPQSFALYPHLSVRANISYPLDLAHVPASESREVVATAAAMLKIEEHLDKKPDQLSGGQKQRVAIARGIAKRTDFFVLDDPLAGLDFKLREQLVDDLRGLNTATGASILYVTSDVIEAMTLADELAVLAAGTVIEHGLPETLYREPRTLGTMALVGFPPANFLRGSMERRDGATWCATSLFAFPVDVQSNTAVGRRHRRVPAGADPSLPSHWRPRRQRWPNAAVPGIRGVARRSRRRGYRLPRGRRRIPDDGRSRSRPWRRSGSGGDGFDRSPQPCPLRRRNGRTDRARCSPRGPPTRPAATDFRLQTRWSAMADIRVEQLTKTFGSLHAVDDVSFTFPSGQVTCLLGPSGCGKTTLMRIIAGLETQTAGAVYFGDRDVSRLSPSKRNIGMVFQYPVVYRGISVYRNIELPLQSMKLSKRRADAARRRRDPAVGSCRKRQPRRLETRQRYAPEGVGRARGGEATAVHPVR